ncbi:MBL fold metallo-hydrolase [Waterburya agarophytonicola K14]|uniref:MBL fold metallo-hydrolase n=1 Tax=Waterburya agarophytonicola KI4 TaxID=2874699 RepID=A0A964BSB2_9CYAN|nr:MBL fold metallo-hydrolase [Waterburya agarophytonicola]MCC0176945.1 MBL fold metallo-hydrolase [Waterburya agarophytonicola KI4]
MKTRQGQTGSISLPLSCFVYAAGHEDEGVCLLLHIGKYRILLDCGLADLGDLSERNKSPADIVVCSHAHEDHCRSLWQLHRNFPELPIYVSEVTSKLLPFYWVDDPSLENLDWCQTLPWRSPIDIAPDLQIEIVPAGHLPGAAAIIITYRTTERSYKVMYTGDFSVSNFQLVEGMSIENLRGISPDVLILEGSYGTVRHPHRRLQEKQLMERIDRALSQGKNVLLPVPPIGLGQEILKLLRSHHQFTGRDLDIWVDESVAVTCDLYLELLPQFPLPVQNFAKHQPLFWDERICPRMRRLNNGERSLGNQNQGVFLVDYQSDLWQYLTGETECLVLLAEHPQEYLHPDSPRLDLIQNLSYVTIETYLLAEHSDGRNTTQLIHNLRPQHVIFVHGSLSYLLELASLEELRNRYQIHSPVGGILVELPIGDRFVQPQAPQPVYYEGELNEIGSAIAINLPYDISSDPRWQNIADTGIIQAHWQGDELVVRGVSQRELLNVNSQARISSDLDCCNRCQYYRDRRCWNRASPLCGFKVIPEGYCPVFEAMEEKS